MDELAAWLRLSLSPGIGTQVGRRLLAALGLPVQIFETPPSALRTLLTPMQVEALSRLPKGFAEQWALTQKWLEDASRDGVPRAIVCLGDAGYPAALLQMEDPPLMLYLLGRGQFGAQASSIHLTNSIAMVGSRNPSHQGAENAHRFARELALQGMTVVSGMALGIDAASHLGALAADQPGSTATVAVVGTGLDRVYPAKHRQLAHEIAEHGLLVSEYCLGTPPLSPNFPRRNRLIAGLSQGTLVVEAALQSGSLITARLAVEQGKDVFAIPGSIHAPQSRGCHALIKQGAMLVESVEDILQAWPQPDGVSARAVASPDTQTLSVAPTEPALLQALGQDPVGLDALQARTGLDTASLQAELLLLELAGQVGRLPGGLFQRKGSA